MAISKIENASLASGVPSRSQLPAGTVLQVVQGVLTSTFTTTNYTSFVDITGLSAAITPTSSSSKILVRVLSPNLATDGSAGDGMLQVLRDSTAIGNATSGGTAPISGYVATYPDSIYSQAYVFECLDSPNTTSSVTYKVQCRLWNNGGNWGTLYIGRRSLNASFISPSVITLMEIAQ